MHIMNISQPHFYDYRVFIEFETDKNNQYMIGFYRADFPHFCGGQIIHSLTLFQKSEEKVYLCNQEDVRYADHYRVLVQALPRILEKYHSVCNYIFFIGDSVSVYDRVSGCGVGNPKTLPELKKYPYRGIFHYDPNEISFPEEADYSESEEYYISIPWFMIIEDARDQLEEVFNIGCATSHVSSNHAHEVGGYILARKG